MPTFTGRSINLSFQEAFEDAVRQALIHRVEDDHELLKTVEVTRIYSARNEANAFGTLCVEIDAQ